MILEVLGSVLLGLGLSWAASHRLSHRLPPQRTVFTAGPLGALFGTYLTHTALGPGHVVATLVGALLVGAVLLSLLLRPAGRRLHRAQPS
ncbi:MULTISPECIES: hypothetical protein [unclassified Streptomyces]|uniref:hypothetical protein n=1 Tax=unclassified Streptomyces TaxID=2593676 RepID=UPI003827251C